MNTCSRIITTGASLAMCAAFTTSPTAHADEFVTYEAGATLGMPFGVGSGISNTDFFLATDALSGVSIGLRARQRWQDNVSFDGNTYFVQPGYSAISQGSSTMSPYAWWNFDFAVYGGGIGLGNAFIVMQVDFDPADGTSVGTTAQIPFNYVPGAPLSGPYLGSENMGFDYWNSQFGQLFDPNALGNYTISLGIQWTSGEFAGRVVTSDIFVQVIPAPAGMALLGLCGLVPSRRRR